MKICATTPGRRILCADTDEYIHIKFEGDRNIRTLPEMMVVGYTYKLDDTQKVLRPLALSFLQQISRQYAAAH